MGDDELRDVVAGDREDPLQVGDAASCLLGGR
jgi:hypothetical protein